MSSPFISVIITAYRRKEFLKFAVESVLSQSIDSSNYELIITKDFHDEELDEIIKRNGIKGIFLEGDSIGKRMAHALEFAKGEVIAFLDDDDIWDRDKLSHVFRIFSSDGSIVFYHNAEFFIDDNGIELPGLSGWDPNENIKEMREIRILPSQLGRYDMLRLMHLYLSFNASSIVVRKRILDQNISVLQEIDSSPDDFLLFSALISGGRLVADDEMLTGYRVHKMNVSAFTSKEDANVPYQGNYRHRQYAAYQVMVNLFARGVQGHILYAFQYSMNYVKLTAMLSTIYGTRREMASVSRLQLVYSLRYLISSSGHSILKSRKFGLWYNVRLSALSALFLFSPGLARSLYSYMYAEMK